MMICVKLEHNIQF